MRNTIKSCQICLRQFGLREVIKRVIIKILYRIKPPKLPFYLLHCEVSNICNLNCEYCVLKTNMKDRQIMSVETFNLIKPYFKNVPRIYLGGIAEPLLNKNLSKFVRIIKKESPFSYVYLTSNATLLTKELSKKLVEAGLDEFTFSLDGVEPDIIDKIRKGSSLKNIIENIKILQNIKKKMNSKTPMVSAVTVLQKSNYSRLPKIIQLASEMGIKKILVNHLEPYTKDMVKNILWDVKSDNLNKVLEESIKLADKKKIELHIANSVPKPAYCNMVDNPIILANGDVLPCHVFIYDRDYFFKPDKKGLVSQKKSHLKKKCFGNVNKDSLEKIWFSKDYANFRKKVKSGTFPQGCNICLMKHGLICG